VTLLGQPAIRTERAAHKHCLSRAPTVIQQDAQAVKCLH